MSNPVDSIQQHLLIFEVAGHRCAIPTDRIRELVHFAALAVSPGQPTILEGFLNLRGTAVPVMRLRRLFVPGIAEPHLHSPLVVIEYPEGPMAVLADRVEDVISGDHVGLRPIEGPHSINEVAEGQFTLGGQDVILLSCDRLLLEKERQCFSELQAEAQRRLDEAVVKRS